MLRLFIYEGHRRKKRPKETDKEHFHLFIFSFNFWIFETILITLNRSRIYSNINIIGDITLSLFCFFFYR